MEGRMVLVLGGRTKIEHREEQNDVDTDPPEPPFLARRSTLNFHSFHQHSQLKSAYTRNTSSSSQLKYTLDPISILLTQHTAPLSPVRIPPAQKEVGRRWKVGRRDRGWRSVDGL